MRTVQTERERLTGVNEALKAQEAELVKQKDGLKREREGLEELALKLQHKSAEVEEIATVCIIYNL